MNHAATKPQIEDLPAYATAEERPLLSDFISLILEDGYVISINNGGEENELNRSDDKYEILENMAQSGEDWIKIVKTPTPADPSTILVGTFYLIYNNGSDGDPMIAICDYTSNDICNNYWNTLNGMWGE